MPKRARSASGESVVPVEAEPQVATPGPWDLRDLPQHITGESAARVLELADPSKIITPLDFTTIDGGIPAEYRHFDAIARLLMFHTTRCAAVAVDPTTNQLVIAFNSGEPAANSIMVGALFKALTNMYTNTLDAEDREVLYALVDKMEKFSDVVRIMSNDVDAIPKESLQELHKYYEEKLEAAHHNQWTFYKSQMDRIEKIMSEPVQSPQYKQELKLLRKQERKSLYSKYKRFLMADNTHEKTDRLERDMAKVSRTIGKWLPNGMASKPYHVIPVEQMRVGHQGAIELNAHAETSLVAYFLRRYRKLPRYIGISMHCCRTCGACMHALYNGQKGYRGESIFRFGNVIVPQIVLQEIHRVNSVVECAIRRLVSGRKKLIELGTQEHDLSGSDADTDTEGRVKRTGIGKALAESREERMALQRPASAANAVAVDKKALIDAASIALICKRMVDTVAHAVDYVMPKTASHVRDSLRAAFSACAATQQSKDSALSLTLSLAAVPTDFWHSRQRNEAITQLAQALQIELGGQLQSPEARVEKIAAIALDIAKNIRLDAGDEADQPAVTRAVRETAKLIVADAESRLASCRAPGHGEVLGMPEPGAAMQAEDAEAYRIDDGYSTERPAKRRPIVRNVVPSAVPLSTFYRRRGRVLGRRGASR